MLEWLKNTVKNRSLVSRLIFLFFFSEQNDEQRYAS